MGEAEPADAGMEAAAAALGDPEALQLLAELVALAPTNLEDPTSGRYEKPHYGAAIARIERAAREWGLTTRRFDPTLDVPGHPPLPGGRRPNLIVDLDVGATERVLILAHYDVVPIPAEQLTRWKSPPHTLSWRDGRLFGRGANDDLGSGVIGSLLALKRLTSGPAPPRNVRLLVCCDEETGGAGGIEPMKEHDQALPEGDPHRFLLGTSRSFPMGVPTLRRAPRVPRSWMRRSMRPSDCWRSSIWGRRWSGCTNGSAGGAPSTRRQTGRTTAPPNPSSPVERPSLGSTPGPPTPRLARANSSSRTRRPTRPIRSRSP
ncbi:MAG: M20/M25/M40 family metallo-hydrolase [Thermoplasmata archaeon]|nr:M20/M25/M40 family metallo-hydrolase [Thermoplasmata archaeon]